MSNFIKLTILKDLSKALINMDVVEMVYEKEVGCVITMPNDDSYRVVETLQEIEMALSKLKQNH